jgi:sugar O-acyltransferase (sialic acid O-acetyltransferase NeuD family)
MKSKVAAKPLIIVGAGGHGRVVLDAANARRLPVNGFIDTVARRGEEVNGCTVLGNNGLLDDRECLSAHTFIVAIGNQKVRRELSLLLLERASLSTVIHPRTMISSSASIGAGTAIIAGAIVNANAKVGRFCILNTGCTVDHDNYLADGVQVCPGVHLAGNVRCGADAFIGTGAVAIPGISIGANAIVGAGATVIRDVPDSAKVVGNPARILGHPPSKF